MTIHADEDDEEKMRKESLLAARNYYGDVVRNLFIAADVIMLMVLPLFYAKIPLPTIVVIFGIIVIALAALFTNWNAKWSLIADTAISGLSFIFIESNAVVEYRAPHTSLLFMFFSQVLSLLFFIALYYSAQTLRRWGKE